MEQQIGGYPRPDQLLSDVDPQTLDSEGRCVILEFPGFVLFGVYSPATRDESRDEFRISFFQALDIRIRNLVEMGKQVILTGDLNVIRSEIDTSNLAEALRKEDMTMDDWLDRPTRRIFNQLIFDGTFKGPRDEGREKPILRDLTRCFHPTRQGMNTCWDTKRNTRPANNGSRIDYILCTDGLMKWFSGANIQEGLMGSDHCPVWAEMDDELTSEGVVEHLTDLVFPTDMFRMGCRLREWGSKDLLPLSARLIPEFDGRRSIRDMFSRVAPAPTKPLSPGEPTRSTSQTTTSAPPSLTFEAKRDGASPRLGGPISVTSNAAPVTASPTSSDTTKRNSQPHDAPARAIKRTKTSSDGPKRKIAPGQKTLQGFFTRGGVSSPVGETDPASTTDVRPPIRDSTATTQAAHKHEQDVQQPRPTTPSRPPKRSASAVSPPSPASAGKVFDPIEAKESWSRLLGKRVVPRCEHNEPCISLLTKKPGVNCGKICHLTVFALYFHALPPK